MPASQDWRAFFQGSPLAFVYKVPLLLVVGLLFAVYSGIKAFVLRLPNLFLNILHYADVCYDQILRFLVRWSARFYEGVLRPIPSYISQHILPWMQDAMLLVIDSATHWGRLCYRSVIEPLAQISYNFLRSLLVAVGRRCYWLWLHCLRPLYPLIRDRLLPWLAGNLLRFLRTTRWFLHQTIHSIDTLLRFLLHRVVSPLYRTSRTLIVFVTNGVDRWTRTILYHLVKSLFLIFAHLARNVISACYAVKSLYREHLLPCWTSFVALIWLIGGHVWTILASLVDAVQRFSQFCYNSLLPAVGQALSTSSSLLANLWMDVRTTVFDAVQVASQLIDGIYRNMNTTR